MSDDGNIITRIPRTGSQHITQEIGFDVLKTTVVSSVSTFVVTTILFTAIIGSVYGYQIICKKKYCDRQSSNPIAMYEDVIPRSSVRQQEASLELKTNVAYSSNPSN